MRDARAAPAPPAPGPDDADPRRRSRGALVAILGAGSLAVLLLMALGSWQVYRLAWKLDLIATVDARVHAPPVAPPAPTAWPSVTADADQYLHVTARGTYDHSRETFVQAVTDVGPGFWLATPFRTEGGFTVLVNRGFVPPERRDAASRAAGEVAGPTVVTGLLRVDEPGGAFLRHNDPAADRWFSRDVPAIAAKRGLAGPVAPYFIDADDAPVPGGFPIGGLTVVAFPNNHLVYAITWYAMGLGLAGALAWVVREERRPGRRA